jgi:SpoIIAA-like
MLERLASPETVVALRMTGRVDQQDIERGIEAVEAALAAHPRIALYAEIEMTGLTGGAFARDLGYSLGKLRELHRFPRVAVVTGQDWVRSIARIQDSILPQVEVRSFSPVERDEAMAWVSGPLDDVKEEAPVAATPSVQLIETTRPDVIAFQVDGRIRGDDMRRLVAVFDEASQMHARVRVLARIARFDGVSLEALRSQALPSVKLRAWRRVERYAMVGGPDWMETAARWAVPLVPVETRHFRLDQEEEAWKWLDAKPA